MLVLFRLYSVCLIGMGLIMLAHPASHSLLEKAYFTRGAIPSGELMAQLSGFTVPDDIGLPDKREPGGSR